MPAAKLPSLPNCPNVRAGLGALLYSVAVWFFKSPRFPNPKPQAVVFKNPGRLEQIKAVKPESPTLHLQINIPTLVPGLSVLPWAKNQSLSHDLCNLVYSAPADGKNRVYLCNRTSGTEDFTVPQEILTQISDPKDFPSLSPNGLEIVFCAYSERPALWHAVRDAVTSSFQAAKPLVISGLETDRWVFDACSWVSDDAIRICGFEEGHPSRQHLVLKQLDDSTFKVDEKLSISHSSLLFDFDTGVNRGYALTDNGIQLTARRAQGESFITPELLVDTGIIGPAHEPTNNQIFVVPKEDVIFFIGPGPNNHGPENNRIWMLRIQ